MALIKTVTIESEEGKKNPIYTAFLNATGMVPRPMIMLSASPGIMQIQTQLIQYYRNHPRLEMPLLSTIRYLVARMFDYKPCIAFNRRLLKMQGMEEKELETLANDPSSAPLEDKDIAMLVFVIKALHTPERISQEDIDQLHGNDWSDRDILDALYHGAIMLGPSLMIKAFQFDEE